MKTDIITPQTNPHHTVVGKHFAGHSFQHNSTQIYFCDSYDPRQGFWLTNVADSTDRKNVSERAIGRTFHLAEDRQDHWWVHQWHVSVPKATAKK